MTKINKHIKIISSSKSYLSSMSLKSRLSVEQILKRHFEQVSVSLVDDMNDLRAAVNDRPDMVFLGLKFIPSKPELGINDPNKIWVSDYLADRGIIATGSSGSAHRLDVNKDLAKQAVAEAGLHTSPFELIKRQGPDHVPQINLDFPLFVKPSNRGGGLGIDSNSVVYDRQQMREKISHIANTYQSDAIIEEFLPGREFSVAILRQSHDMKYTAMPIELVTEADERGVSLLAGDVKSANNEQVLTVEDTELESQLSNLAIGAFKAIGGRDYGRIDIRLDTSGAPTFLEVNLMPSLIENYGSFPKSCSLNLNMDHEATILSIIRLAMLRSDMHEFSSLDNLTLSRLAVSNF